MRKTIIILALLYSTAVQAQAVDQWAIDNAARDDSALKDADVANANWRTFYAQQQLEKQQQVIDAQRKQLEESQQNNYAPAARNSDPLENCGLSGFEKGATCGR